MRVVRGPLTGVVAGVLWGIVARAWMRLVTDFPEFSWEGTLYIVGAFAIVGATGGMAVMASNRGWRGAVVVRAVALASTILLAVGAGMLMVPTIVFGGIALGVRRLDELALPWRILTVVPVVAMVGLVGVGPELGITLAVVGAALVVIGLVLAGRQVRIVLATVATVPALGAMWSVVTIDIPLWRGLLGAALYLPLVAGPTLLFAMVLAGRPHPRADVLAIHGRTSPTASDAKPVVRAGG